MRAHDCHVLTDPSREDRFWNLTTPSDRVAGNIQKHIACLDGD